MSSRALDVTLREKLSAPSGPDGPAGRGAPSDARLRRRRSLWFAAAAPGLSLVLLALLSTVSPYVRHGGPIVLRLSQDHAVHLIDLGPVSLAGLAARQAVLRLIR